MSKESVKQWIIKAEHDLKTAKDEIITDNPATDVVCFHTQQCAEKYLKAYLVYNDIEITKSLKTHDISELIDFCKDIETMFGQVISENEADKLTNYAIEIRYPDDFYFPSIEESESAIETAEKVKGFILNKIKHDF